MLDIGFIGYISVGGTLPLAIQCRDSEQAISSPSSAPTFSVYPNGFDSATATGSLGATDTDSKAGFRTGSLSISNSFVSGELYTIIFEYTTGSSRSAIGTFQVV